jgi:hypothetical protein
MSESGATWHGYWDRGTSAALFPHARQHSDEERPVDEVRLTRKLRREEWVWPTSAWRRSRSLVETSGDHVTSLVIAAAALAVSIVR